MKIAEIPLTAGSTHQTPSKVVLHAMAEIIDTDGKDYMAVDFLAKLGLSAHSLVTPSGVVIRCRGYQEGAYHAKGHNTNSLGIEFLVRGLHDYGSFLHAIQKPYLTNEQYQAGLEQVHQWLVKMTQLDNDNLPIFTHQQLDPQRKYDPGEGFPLKQFKKDLANLLRG